MTETCLRCGPTAGTQLPDRVTCSTCGRLVRWLDRPADAAVPAAATAGPAAWLYVSRRLDLDWLPNAPFWSAPVVILGGRPFYRLTPAVAVWLEHAADALDRRHQERPLDPDELAEALAALRTVWVFAAAHLDPAGLRAARAFAPELPPVPAVPDDRSCWTPATVQQPPAEPAPAARRAVLPPPVPNRKPARAGRRSSAGERFAAAAGPLFTAGES